MAKFLSFQDIPLFPRASYQVNVGWQYLEEYIQGQTSVPEGMAALDLDPDFQRAHVWTEAQQRTYIEYCLQGGEVGRRLTFNCAGWGITDKGPYVIVDGKQRLEAIRKFMRSELKAFGQYYREFTGHLRIVTGDIVWCVCALETREEVLQLYLNINAGGTPHTADELDKVRKLLKAEQRNKKKETT